MNRDPQCFACQRAISPTARIETAWTSDPTSVHVGAECWKKICAGGTEGWQPPKGGPRLFQVPPGSNRTHDAAYLSKGERALIVRSLKHFVHDQQQMIQGAYLVYISPYSKTKAGPSQKNKDIFADHKQHHEKQIKAAGDLLDRFHQRTIGINPDERKQA